ncbi:hypothetical protein HELRODRAFT_175956 [Helobdella robusta]|uniref:Uncharacterized protein n=1 Tax=Helobdella robusta TaxID=6412 RepID=T1F9Y8_HELRO|nr:hypothetical protein HELRODRAFT_175956 [Helobdella robusta]ESO00514.1 hypothetical protein HELRODRAFT_175956 [Helobdella robusta]
MVARFRHRYGALSVTVCYAPTNEATAETKDLFYSALEDSFRFTRLTDLIFICLGDFIAVTGVDHRMPAVVGPISSGLPNNNSDCFLEFLPPLDVRPLSRFNIRLLRDNVTAATYTAEVEKCFITAPENEFSSWDSFCDAMAKRLIRFLVMQFPCVMSGSQPQQGN